MTRQQLTRRMVLGALVVMVAMAALGSGDDASATKRPDYGSRAAMQAECELLGGTFLDYGDGNLFCAYPGTRIICDTNGQDCSSDRQQAPDGRGDAHLETGGDVAMEVGETAPLAPVVDRLPLQEGQSVLETVP